MKNEPLVSVLMTAYNREQYIAEAIESVLASTYTSFELIVVDDCSRDNTIEIARKYEQRDNRVRVFVNDVNLGDYLNRNKAASYAEGEFLKYLDSDDIIYPWSLEAFVTCMVRFPNAPIGISTDLQVNNPYPIPLEPEQAFRLYFYKNMVLYTGPSGVIINKKVFEKVGGFSSEQYISDTELWLKIAKSNQTVVVPPGLIFWREHDGQQIREERKGFEIEFKRLKLNAEILLAKDSPLPMQEGRTILRNLKNIKCRQILFALMRGRFREATRRSRILKLSLLDFILCLFRNKIYEF